MEDLIVVKSGHSLRMKQLKSAHNPCFHLIFNFYCFLYYFFFVLMRAAGYKITMCIFRNFSKRQAYFYKKVQCKIK
jgi:hypothetical protein